MITLKSAHEIEAMRLAGKITAAARALAREMVKPGVTTQQIDKAVFHFIREQGAIPSFLHYNGYPASVCISVNAVSYTHLLSMSMKSSAARSVRPALRSKEVCRYD